jgi:hypothetical protein
MAAAMRKKRAKMKETITKQGTIGRLDQGHLYPNPEVPGLTCPGRGSNPGLPRGKRAL